MLFSSSRQGQHPVIYAPRDTDFRLSIGTAARTARPGAFMGNRTMSCNRTLLIVTVIAVLPLAASADDPVIMPLRMPVMIPVMPVEIGDQCSVFALVDSTSLVDTYKADTITDLDGDGSVTDADFAEWIKTQVAPHLVVNDVDGDGYLTAIDKVAALAVVLDKLSGDGNADGGATIEGTAESAVADAVRILITLPGSLTRSYYTQGHVRAITEGWGPGRHCAETSGFSRPDDRDRFPPNHDFAISRNWPGNHFVHVSENWPAQHRGEISGGWPWPGDRPGQHQTGTSTGWPPNHGRAQSESWDEPPNGPHLTVLSAVWPPDHDFVQSRTPGPGGTHYAAISEMDPQPGFPLPGYPEIPDVLPGPVVEHQQSHSSTWWPHNVALSGFFWPPNHAGAISHSWTDASHVITVSQQWPATHHEFVSRNWQTNDDGEYPRWPPNHDISVSSPGDGPVGPPPPPARPWWLPNLFPPGHSVSTTIQQWLPFFP